MHIVTVEHKWPSVVFEPEEDLHFIVWSEEEGVFLGNPILLQRLSMISTSSAKGGATVAGDDPAELEMDVNRMPPAATAVLQAPDFPHTFTRGSDEGPGEIHQLPIDGPRPV